MPENGFLRGFDKRPLALNFYRDGNVRSWDLTRWVTIDFWEKLE